jgi:hypothetical protein
MNNYTKIQISAKIYWGFNIEILNEKLNIMDDKDIVNEIKSIMKTFFLLHGMEELKEGVDKLNLHIHDRPTSLGQTIYVCDHE